LWSERHDKVASIGRAASSHLQLLMLKNATGIRMDIVHFDGSSKSYQQVIGGNIDASIGGPASGRQSSDYFHFIGVFRPGPEAVPPDVPPMKEQAFDMPYISQVWYTYAAPKTPPDRLDKLEAAFTKALSTPVAIEAQSRAGFTRLRQISRKELKEIKQKSYDLANAYKA